MRDACVACIRHRKHREPLSMQETRLLVETVSIRLTQMLTPVATTLVYRPDALWSDLRRWSPATHRKRETGPVIWFAGPRKFNVEEMSSQAKQLLETCSDTVVFGCVRSRTYVQSTIQQKIKVSMKCRRQMEQRRGEIRFAFNARPEKGADGVSSDVQNKGGE